MSFSSFVKERQFNPAQATNRANKILSDSQKLVDQMRAVNDFELKAQANLVTNLRQYRQDESRRDTRNNQLIIQGLRQRASYEQRQAQTQAQDKALEIKAKEAKLDQQVKAFGDLAKGAGDVLAGEINRAKAEVDEQLANTINLGYVLDPQSFEGDFLGAEAKLNAQEDQMLLETAKKAVEGKGKIFGLFDVAGDSYVKAQTAKLFALKTAQEIQGADLVRDEINNNPDRTINIINANGEEQSYRIGDIKSQVPNNETFNLVYKTLGFELFKERMQAQGLYDGVDGAVFGESFKTLNQYANTKTSQFSRFADRERSKQKREIAKQRIMFASDDTETAKFMVQFVNLAAADPEFSVAESFKDIEDMLKDIPNAYEVAKLVIQQTEAAGVPDFGRTNQAKSLLRAANNAAVDKIQEDNRNAELEADEYYENKLLPLILGDNKVDIVEFDMIDDYITAEEGKGNMTQDVALALRDRLKDSYKEYGISKTNIDTILYKINTGEATKEDLDHMVRNGIITLDERKIALDRLNVLNKAVAEGRIEGYTDSEMKRVFSLELASKVDGLSVSGQNINPSVEMAALRSVQEYRRMFNINMESMPADQAALKASADVLKAIQDGKKGSIYEVGLHPDAGDPKSGVAPGTLIFSNVVPGGGGSNPLRVPGSPESTPEVAAVLVKSRDSVYLKPANIEFDLSLEVYADQIRSGRPLVLSPRDQSIVDAAGISGKEYVEDRFRINNIQLKVPEGSFDVLREKVREYPELEKELQKPFKSTLQYNSIIDQIPDLSPADLGTGDQAFHNAVSIAQKIGSPAPELIAARFMSDTQGNTNRSSFAGRSPAQYLSDLNRQLIEDPAAVDFTPQTSLNVMLAAVGDGDSLRGILSGLGVTSRVPRAGMRTTIARMGNTGKINRTSLSQDILKGTSRTNLVPLIQRAAMQHNIPAPIIAGLIATETSFREDVLTGAITSSARAVGAGQFLEGTAKEFGIDRYDIVSSINGVGKYLRYLINYFKGDMRLAISAYNGGLGNIEHYGGPIPNNAENQAYYPKVIDYARRYGYGQ